MATPAQPEEPPLVGLLLQSKKALQHGEQLCSRANTLSNASAQCSFDVLALDAQVRWMSEAVLQQLKLAAGVAKSIEYKRAQLDKQVEEWDAVRIQHINALDNVLESLGSQLVPHEFYQLPSDSSLFGSQHSEDAVSVNGINGEGGLDMIADLDSKGKHADRSTWKTLRDFVDERAIEDVLESIDSERARLDDVMASTYDFPERLTRTIFSIRSSLPKPTLLSSVEDIIVKQEKCSTGMASQLESLAAHYDQMAEALRDSEAGEIFAEEDLQAMIRDTEELPSIMAELEESSTTIESSYENLLSMKRDAQKQSDIHRATLDDLDELGEIMTEMLQKQQDVERDCHEISEGLQHQQLTIEELYQRFVLYQSSFDKLLLEIARRRQYQEAAEKLVASMISQLEAMTEEERQLRSEFNAEYGAHIPADICLCIENAPTRWKVAPWHGDALEVLPRIDDDLLVQATDKQLRVEVSMPGTDSL